MVAASRASPAARPSPALQRARRAWALLQADSARSVALAGQALARAREQGDAPARAWAQLVLGYNRLYLSTPAEALATLAPLREDFERLGDRAGAILLEAGIARAWWRQGRLQEAHRHLQQLRDEGLRVLRHEQRGVLLNAIAGSHSALGDSEQAFAHMVSALHEARPSRAPGFDVVLHCNLSNELMQLGDAEAALAQVDEGLARCRRLANPRLLATLLINRVIALTELGRAREALADLQAVRAIPADEQGRGRNASCFEVLAVAALRAGEVALGRELVAAAAMSHHEPIADESHEMAQARALLAAAEGEVEGALAVMQPLRERLLDDGTDDGLSMRVRCSGLHLLSELCEHAGRPDEALAALRAWQRCQARRSSMASRARAQAALLQTELMRLHRRLEEQEARRRDTESARAALQAINEQLSRKVHEVEQLQVALREQATRDPLTGLFNRRHLADVLPPMLALARREALPMAVAIIDLDHFKAVNDRHGHDAGDHLLVAFGALLQDDSRASDVVCRYGGEEFCLLMPHTTAMAAAHHLGQLLQRWRTQVFEHQGRRLSGLSFTAGVCDSTRPGAGGEALLQAADQALLAAKREGRAQVRLVGP
ncbi:MAG: GGDEF domain-containing protein [Rubrivivax sp.]|nr:GGDEF domain-containing protein [Rubrivivax sp.]